MRTTIRPSLRTTFETYLVDPVDDRLIYRTGDGHNHRAMYTLIFADGQVSDFAAPTASSLRRLRIRKSLVHNSY